MLVLWAMRADGQSGEADDDPSAEASAATTQLVSNGSANLPAADRGLMHRGGEEDD